MTDKIPDYAYPCYPGSLIWRITQPVPPLQEVAPESAFLTVQRWAGGLCLTAADPYLTHIDYESADNLTRAVLRWKSLSTSLSDSKLPGECTMLYEPYAPDEFARFGHTYFLSDGADSRTGVTFTVRKSQDTGGRRCVPVVRLCWWRGRDIHFQISWSAHRVLSLDAAQRSLMANGKLAAAATVRNCINQHLTTMNKLQAEVSPIGQPFFPLRTTKTCVTDKVRKTCQRLSSPDRYRWYYPGYQRVGVQFEHTEDGERCMWLRDGFEDGEALPNDTLHFLKGICKQPDSMVHRDGECADGCTVLDAAYIQQIRTQFEVCLLLMKSLPWRMLSTFVVDQEVAYLT